MAAGLKRDPIVILRIDGEELQEYMSNPVFETDMMLIFSETATPDGTFCDQIVKALQKLGVDQGLPPISDSWVIYYTISVFPLLHLLIIYFKCIIDHICIIFCRL